MTLQEKIQKKANEYGELASAFLEGTKFALENQWISVKDDLPCNLLEKLVVFVYDSSSYIYMKKSFPEDFIESRTNWEDMVNYADEMASFIEEIMEDITNTKTL